MSHTAKMPRLSQIDYFDKLKDAGVSEKQARVIIDFVNDAGLKNTGNLVTKEYFSEHLNARFAEFELSITKRINALLVMVMVSIIAPIVLHHIGWL